MLLDDRRTRVVVLVDAVAEAHQLGGVLLVLHLADVGLHVPALVLDALQHLEDGLVGATVERAGQRTDACGDRDVDVRPGGTDHADGRRRTVLLVVGVQDQQHVEGAGEGVVERIRAGREPERHPQEVLDVAQRVVGIEERLADGVLVAVRGKGGHGAQQQVRCPVGVVRVRAVLGLGERGQRVEPCRQHGHRVRLAGQRAEHLAHALVDQVVLRDAGLELLQLLRRRQFAVEHEVGDLEEGGLLRQLLDGVAAVPQDAGIAVDEGDRRAAGGRVGEPDVKGCVTGHRQQLGDVVAVVSLRRWREGEFKADLIVAEGCVAHPSSVQVVGRAAARRPAQWWCHLTPRPSAAAGRSCRCGPRG